MARWKRSAWAVLGCLAIGLSASAADEPAEANADAEPQAEQPQAEPRFVVKQVELEGVTGDLATQDAVLGAVVTLRQDADGMYVAAPEAEGGRPVRLRDIGGPEHAGWEVDASVIRAIASEVFAVYRRGKWAAVRVSVPRQSISELTADGSGVLLIDVDEGRVGSVRTFKRGDDDELVESDDGVGERILELSPISPDDPVRTDTLNRYVYWLNRHPGRRIDVALNPGTGVNEVALDFIVTQRKPWSVYFQASNTGTSNTPRWRQRFGFIHTNLTGADDILALDYITGNFGQVNAFSGSYERPIPGVFDERVRLRIFGTWSEYLASDVGLPGLDLVGRSFSVGGELAANVFQHNETFIDLVAGIQFENADVDNGTLGIEGDSGFLLPYFGVRGDRRTPTSNTFGSAIFETSLPGVADNADLLALGRLDTSTTWWTFEYSLAHSFYLDPLFNPNWGEPESGSTLAHELSAALRGQFVFGDRRVVPNFTQTVGGFFTVRGYPESFTSGDTVIISSFEYRLHIPRLFGPGEPAEVFGHPFKWRPSRQLGPVDWDLIFRTFVDIGRNVNNDRFSFENNNTLIGTGFGLELAILTNVSTRFDWGWAVKDAANGAEVWNAGDMRFHMLFTVSY